MTFERNYLGTRPLLHPKMMHRVGGGFTAPTQEAFGEVESLQAVVERLSVEKAQVVGALKDSETELRGATASAEQFKAQLYVVEERDAQQAVLLQNAQSMLQRAMEQLQIEQDQLRLTRMDLQSSREESARELHASRARLKEKGAEAQELTNQVAQLLTHRGASPCLTTHMHTVARQTRGVNWHGCHTNPLAHLSALFADEHQHTNEAKLVELAGELTGTQGSLADERRKADALRLEMRAAGSRATDSERWGAGLSDQLAERQVELERLREKVRRDAAETEQTRRHHTQSTQAADLPFTHATMTGAVDARSRSH